jgi:hypothetical protein
MPDVYFGVNSKQIVSLTTITKNIMSSSYAHQSVDFAS